MLFRNKKKEDASAGKWIAVGGKFEENESLKTINQNKGEGRR